MLRESMGLALLFMGMAVGSISPLGKWGMIGFLAIGTFFVVVDLIQERRK
jgi:hypothetical protein